MTAETLHGHVWIADFIFTRCPDVCPALTARMSGLQGIAGGVQLVSITVDPSHDTPAVLAEYARRAGARPGWRFLTGPRDHVAALLHDGFRVAFGDDGPASAPITHSDRFVLVDRDLRIRGYYHGSDADSMVQLKRDAVRLSEGSAS